MNTKRILSIYLVIWILSVLYFWLFGSSDALAYAIIVFYLVLPLTTLGLSILIGKDKKIEKSYWMILFFGIMYMLANYATFLLKNSIAFNKINMPNFSHIFIGMILSIVGIFIGRKMRKR